MTRILRILPILLFALFVSFVVSSFALANGVVYHWKVNPTEPQDKDIDYARGEIVTLQPSFVGVDVTYTAVYLDYMAMGMTNAYAPVAGTIVNGTNGEVSVTINTACFSTQHVYSYDIYVVGPSIGMKRASGRILVHDSITDNGTTNVVPATQSTIDWATTTQENPSHSGFVSSLDIASLEDFKASCQDGTADLDVNTITGRHSGDAHSMTDFPDEVAMSIVSAGSADVPSIARTGKNTWSITFPSTVVGEILTTNRLMWILPSGTIGYVDTNGITMLNGSLNLYDEDLNCNVNAYDGSAASPSVAWLTDKGLGRGWHRRSWNGSSAWAYSDSSNDVVVLGNDGITIINGGKISGNGANLLNTEPLFTNFLNAAVLPATLQISDPASNVFFSVNRYTGATVIRGQDSDARYNVTTNGFTGTNVFYTVGSNGTGVITNTWVFIGGQRRQ